MRRRFRRPRSRAGSPGPMPAASSFQPSPAPGHCCCWPCWWHRPGWRGPPSGGGACGEAAGPAGRRCPPLRNCGTLPRTTDWRRGPVRRPGTSRSGCAPSVPWADRTVLVPRGTGPWCPSPTTLSGTSTAAPAVPAGWPAPAPPPGSLPCTARCSPTHGRWCACAPPGCRRRSWRAGGGQPRLPSVPWHRRQSAPGGQPRDPG